MFKSDLILTHSCSSNCHSIEWNTFGKFTCANNVEQTKSCTNVENIDKKNFKSQRNRNI